MFPRCGNSGWPLLLINDFHDSVLEDGIDGFYTVIRHNNPLRKFGLVHRDLGKINAVEPECVIRLASGLVNGALPFYNPLVLGLSESSILLGRVVCEFFGGGSYLFSTRYPHDKSELVSFTEPHSHAPSQFLKLSGAGNCREVCIVEDEVTTGNTIMNLIHALTGNLPSIVSIAVLALKVFCSDKRFAEIISLAGTMGINLSIHSIYRGRHNEDSNLNISLKSSQAECGKIPCAAYSPWEYGRGRIDMFSKQKASLRYKRWEEVLAGLSLSGVVTVIGASEAIDLAFEMSYILSRRGHKTFLRHLTISPWEVPGWTFPPSSPGAKPLHLYMPPGKGGTYLIVYDQPFQEEQVIRLTHCLQNIGSKTYIFKGMELC